MGALRVAGMDRTAAMSYPARGAGENRWSEVETAAQPVEQFVAAIERTAVRRTTAHSGGKMVWRVWGEGGAPLVLLHGGSGSWMHWIRNVEDLSRDFMVLVPDLPGLWRIRQAGRAGLGRDGRAGVRGGARRDPRAAARR